MLEDLDIGPLTWVKDEIDLSLASVLASIDKVANNPSDVSDLRFAQTHLYQISGALDMVGLEGCQFYCAALEQFCAKLEKQIIAANNQTLTVFEQAIARLKLYLDGLLKGQPDISVRLYDALKPVMDLQGEPLEQSDLFFPDTSNTAPKDLENRVLGDLDYFEYISAQRLGYQKSLLAWLQTKQKPALDSMTEAIVNVTAVQKKPADKTLWWAASAFTEALSEPEIAEQMGAKKLCRKLDQELKLTQAGISKPRNQLLRDILYYVAISRNERQNIVKVKEVFGLDDVIGRDADKFAHQETIDGNESAAVTSLLNALSGISASWDELSNKIDFSNISADAKSNTAIDHVLVTKCANQLLATHPLALQLRQVVVVDLHSALLSVLNHLQKTTHLNNYTDLIEVAASLNLLENALENYQQLDADRIQKLLSEIQRLEAIASGTSFDKLGEDRTGDLDKDTIKAVVTHIKDSLKTIEQALDSFFRNPADKSALSLTQKPFNELQAVLDMLNLSNASSIAKASNRYIAYFQSDVFKQNAGEFELLAESLSMLGLYADEMPKVRPLSEIALSQALERLVTNLANLGIKIDLTPADAGSTQPAKTASITSEMHIDEDNEYDVVNELQNKQVQVEATLIENNALSTETDQTEEATVVDQAFDNELLEFYLTEAEEVLAVIARNCQLLRVNPTNDEALMQVRRSYHTLKGSGRTIGLSALGDLAGGLETFLNQIIDQKITLTIAQINEIEKITAAFASWVSTLQQDQKVGVKLAYWQACIAALPNVPKAPKAIKQEPMVLIGGTRKMSKTLYNIFLNESISHIGSIEQDLARTSKKPGIAPTVKARQAIHTIASNALAAGYTAMGELGRSLENWLDLYGANESGRNWTEQSNKLYTNAVSALAGMWQKVSELKTPRPAKAIINAINREITLLQSTATPVLVGNDVIVKSISVPETADDVILNTTSDSALTVTLVEEPLPQLITEEVTLKSAVNKTNQTQAHTNTPQVAKLDTSKVDAELFALFIEEAHEILSDAGSELRAWHSNPQSSKHVDALARALHTLKGGARMAGQMDLGNAVHMLESQVIEARKGELSTEVFDNMFADLDVIGTYFEESVQVDEVDDADEATVAEVHKQPQVRTANRASNYLRMQAATLDRLINEAGEISIIRSRLDRDVTGFKQISTDLTDGVSRMRTYLRELELEADSQLQSRLTSLQQTNENFDPLEFDRFTRLQELTRLMAESVNDIATIQSGFITNLGQAESALQQQNRMNRDLQQTLMSVRMLPFSLLSERMQRIVRQTARELKKRVELVIDGEKTEIDRSVLDKIGAPLEHLLRNAIAHGIEAPADRKKAGKPETAIVRLQVSVKNDEINITVSDDGQGVDLVRIKQKAIETGLIQANANMSEQNLMALMFESGFSTAEKVTKVAGRGVGLDVVRNEITSLGGRIDVDSQSLQGAQFSIHLPVTLTVAQVLMVRAGNTQYALSVAMIEQAQKIKQHALVEAYAAGEIAWGGNHYPLYQLSRLLNPQHQSIENSAYASILLLKSGTYHVALHVDDVIGNQEIVIKTIGEQLARVPSVMGATVTADGKIVLMINPVQMANREVLSAGSIKVNVAVATKQVAKTTVLVVDDSLTMRKVLSRILERDGYEVMIAKDGLDAMQVLQENVPDIILTDIEMPRMDGFGLSRNIRDDVRTKLTPLIMISSRTADKHQNLAKEIGVDAFFGKPVSDEDLLNKIKELIQLKHTKS